MRTFDGRVAVPALVILVGTLIGARAAEAVPGDITLASSSDAGVKGNSHSFFQSLSADGTSAAFDSVATNLDPADADGIIDAYVKDLVTGDLTLVSTSDAGVKGNDSSFSPSPSADASRVTYYSYATNLDPADTDSTADVYVKDLLTGDLTLASTSDGGVKGNGVSAGASLSADGTKVAFFSVATNLDAADIDPTNDIYVKDLVTGDITLASTSDAGVKANGECGFAPVPQSADGTRVAFYSVATNLDPADTDSANDVYVKDVMTGDIILASTSDAGVKANGNSYFPSLSADGTSVAFVSDATNLDPADTDFTEDIYVKDLVTGDVSLASTSDAGIKGNDFSVLPSLSADGTRVAFYSVATNLDPADTDVASDVYVKDLSSGDITLASTSDAGAKGNVDSYEASLSADGRKVAFVSLATNFDPADTDAASDVYVKELEVTPPVECTITGTEGDDVLEGTRRNDVICGLGGNDKVDGGSGGDDLLLGGEGRDVLVGRSGTDILRGEAGNDILRTRDGVRGNDTADGGAGSDRCIIDRGDVVIDCP